MIPYEFFLFAAKIAYTYPQQMDPLLKANPLRNFYLPFLWLCFKRV